MRMKRTDGENVIPVLPFDNVSVNSLRQEQAAIFDLERLINTIVFTR